VKTLLFLTSGPYFFPEQRTVRARYELLSEHFQGFVLSFVSEPQWTRAAMGRFELVGRLVSARAYGILPLRLLLRTWFVITTGLRLHRRHRIDVIIAYDPFMTGLLGYVLSRLTGARLVVEVNNDFGNEANWSKRSWDALTYAKSTFVSVVAPFVLNRAHVVKLLYEGQVSGFRRLRPGIRHVCFHDFVPTSLFETTRPATKQVLFIGHPWYVKGVDVLLRAFNACSPSFPDWELRLVGYLPEKEQYRDLYEFNPRIRFAGPVMPDEVPALMAGCGVVALASRSEGMPRVLIEAMAAGRPVVAAKVGGIPHYIRDGENGLLFHREDAEGLSRALGRLLGDPGTAALLAANGEKCIASRLSDRCWVQAMTQLLSEALAA
jgi:glycosyltransferase involved in cell wall biosynthesis